MLGPLLLVALAPAAPPRSVSLVVASASGLKPAAIDKLTNEVIARLEGDPADVVRRIEIGPSVCLAAPRCIVDALAFVGAELLVALDVLRAGPVAQIQLRAFRGTDGAQVGARQRRLAATEIGAGVLAEEVRALLAEVPAVPRPAGEAPALVEPSAQPPAPGADETPDTAGRLYPWLFGCGVAAALAGVVVFAVGMGEYEAAGKSTTLSDWRTHNARNVALTATGSVVGAVGLAAVVGGVVAFAWSGPVAVTAAPGEGGGAVTLTWHLPVGW